MINADGQPRDVITIGGSAGAIEALLSLFGKLPASVPAAIFVVVHRPPLFESQLVHILGRRTKMPVREPEDGQPVQPGRVYLAPRDYHMVFEDGVVRLNRGPQFHRFRPAVDPLFRSAAYVYGPRTIGVVLTGALDDGTAGLWTIKLRGGTAIVQDPEEALIPSMPLSALKAVSVDHRAKVSEIAGLLARLTREEAPEAPEMPMDEKRKIESEIRIAEEDSALEKWAAAEGDLSPFTCPECHGVLSMLKDGKLVRYRCHTGHAFSPNALLSASTEQIEKRLWDAVRALDETVMLLNGMGEDYAREGNTKAAEMCFTKAKEFYERSQPMREAAINNEEFPTEDLRTARG